MLMMFISPAMMWRSSFMQQMTCCSSNFLVEKAEDCENSLELVHQVAVDHLYL